MYEVYVRQAVEAGLEDVKAGRTLTHEEAIAKLRPPR
jgi:predicted transcriptional regulator